MESLFQHPCQRGLLKNRWVLLILAGIVGIRLCLALLGENLAGDDGDRYLQEAVNLWDHGVFSMIESENPHPTAHDLPLFPAMFALIYGASGDPQTAGRIVSALNCLLFGIAALGVYALADRLVRRKDVALAAMLAFGCFPETLPYAAFYMPDSLFLALFLWSLVFFLDAIRNPVAGGLALSALLFALSILAKPIGIYLGIVLFALFVGVSLHRKTGIRKLVTCSLAAWMTAAAALVPWCLRNDAVFGVFGLSSITGTNLFFYNYRYMLEDMGTVRVQEVMEAKKAAALAELPAGRVNPMTEAVALGGVAKREILRNLPNYAAMTIKRHPRLYVGTGTIALLRLLGDGEGIQALESALADRSRWKQVPVRVLMLQGASWLALLCGYGAAVMGVAVLAGKRHFAPLAFLLGVLLYFAVVIGPVVHTRYRLAMVPFLSVLGGVAWVAMGESLKRSRALNPVRLKVAADVR